MAIYSALDALSAFPDELEAHYSAIPESFRNWAPGSWAGVPSEPFAATGHVCHIRDIEIDGYQVRFRRVLQESNPFLDSLDGMALAVERSYATANAADALSTFRTARAETLGLLRGLTPEQLARKGEFEGYGPVTLAGLIHFLCSHDQQHLSGLQWLLGKMESLAA